MKLEWMGKHRDVVEALIYYCNVYAASYKLEALQYGDVTFSFAQVQVIEYLLENEERNENMSAIAARLGITRSNFTKIVNRLVKKGLLEKLPMPGSHKEMKVTVNALGRELYGAYSQKILRCHFSPMFSCLDRIPEAYYPDIRNALFTAIQGERDRFPATDKPFTGTPGLTKAVEPVSARIAAIDSTGGGTGGD